jgi:hypothetical protein
VRWGFDVRMGTRKNCLYVSLLFVNPMFSDEVFRYVVAVLRFLLL